MVQKIIKTDKTADRTLPVQRSEEPQGVLHKRVLDARGQADQILATARREAERIVAEAKDRLEAAKKESEEAIKRGFASGESKGLSSVTEKLMALEKLKEKFYEGAEPEVVRLSMAVAEKVIEQIGSQGAELVRSVAKQAIERSLGDRIVVRLNPDDVRELEAQEPGLKDVLDKTKRITFPPDDAVGRGGCIVESEVGTIDAQITTQLVAIRKALGI